VRAVNSSTRPIHSQLNKLILARLPLALPPYTTNPSTYISGLLHVAPIYITFESLWQTILDTPPQPVFSTLDGDDNDRRKISSTGALDDRPTNIVCMRIHSLLESLHLPGLLREKRLRSDISSLSGSREPVVKEQLRAVSSSGRLATFIAHTKRSVQANPHVLLAYAWVLYMALFSGGRHLRATLQGAGGTEVDFWNRDPSPVRPRSETKSFQEAREFCAEGKDTDGRPQLAKTRFDDCSSRQPFSRGLEFFNFDGEEDGEDIKIEFKKRMTESEHILTEKEKVDIVSESQVIFEFMVELVGELDRVMGTKAEDLESERLHRSFRVKTTSRDSLTVAHERLSKKKGRNSETFDPHCLIPDLSILRNTLPSLPTVTRSGRRVAFDATTLKTGDRVTGIRVGIASLKTAMAALVAGIALLMAWWLVV
jgi:heme oxygenase